MAMYLREGGASRSQVIAACAANWGSSGPHNNKRTELVRDHKLASNVPTADDAFGHKVYAIALTAKGTARVQAALAPKADAKPAKAKSMPKAKCALFTHVKCWLRI